MKITGKLYPNGEFGIAIAKKFNPDAPVKPVADRHVDLVREYLPQIGWEAIAAIDAERNLPSPLGLSLLPNSRSPAARGSGGITRESARTVRNAAFLLEKKFGKERLSFVTLTLPSVSLDESRLLSQEWHTVVHRVVDEIKRDLGRSQLPQAVIGVTEIQTKRLARTGLAALHLHLLFVGRHRRSDWAIQTERIDDIWQRVLSNRLNRTVVISSACNMQMVKHSAAGYLGKYMTKGKKEVETAKVIQPGMTLPSAWHTCSRALLKAIKKMTIVDSEVMMKLWEELWDGAAVLIEIGGFIAVEVMEGWELRVGAWGRVRHWYRDSMISGAKLRATMFELAM